MSCPTFGNFIKLIKLHSTGSWVSPRDRKRLWWNNCTAVVTAYLGKYLLTAQRETLTSNELSISFYSKPWASSSRDPVRSPRRCERKGRAKRDGRLGEKRGGLGKKWFCIIKLYAKCDLWGKAIFVGQSSGKLFIYGSGLVSWVHTVMIQSTPKVLSRFINMNLL